MTQPPLPLDDPIDDAAPLGPRYTLVWEWVEDWFIPHIRRSINPAPSKGLSWDPDWWRYPEVVARMLALHAAWEEANASTSASAMSTWFISHLEPHLALFFNSDTGPMSKAGQPNFTGHPPLRTTPPIPAEMVDVEPIAALLEFQPLFATVWEWVDEWFVKVVRRRVRSEGGKGPAWDSDWWRYPEVVARFQALHAAWEHARVSESPSAMSTWWVSHLDRHLVIIFDTETGAMSKAGQPNFTGHPQLGATPLPEVVKNQIRPAA